MPVSRPTIPCSLCSSQAGPSWQGRPRATRPALPLLARRRKLVALTAGMQNAKMLAVRPILGPHTAAGRPCAGLRRSNIRRFTEDNRHIGDPLPSATAVSLSGGLHAVYRTRTARGACRLQFVQVIDTWTNRIVIPPMGVPPATCSPVRSSPACVTGTRQYPICFRLGTRARRTCAILTRGWHVVGAQLLKVRIPCR